MPPEKKLNKEDSEKKKLILDELVKGLKQQKRDSDKKQKPEEKGEPVEQPEFSEEVIPQNTPRVSSARAPVLEAIAGEQVRPIFVNRGQSPQNGSEEKGDVGYSPKDRDSNEPKYSSSSSSEVYSAERTDTQDLGRSQNQQFQEISFKSDSRLQGESTTRRKSWNVERFDSESAGRKNPSELDEIKYHKYESKN